MSTTQTNDSIKPLKSKSAHSFMQTKAHITAMVAAMKEVPEITVTEDYQAGTVTAYYTGAKGRNEIFAAIEKGRGQPWIIRHHKMLFA